jgi:phospholipid/cholesterol/gamma-HCH transport system ATP-binding protein
MSASNPILSFQQVSLELRSGYDVGLEDVSLNVAAGELVLVKLQAPLVRVPLADAACGLVEPDSGEVRFMGEPWAQMRPFRSATQRGRIGRVFQEGGWISNLDVDENVTLAQRHHTNRAIEQIEAEALSLAKVFGLSQLPHLRPPQVPRQDLRRWALVRALLGSPALLLLENPTGGSFGDLLGALLSQVSAALARGAAIVWTTDETSVWSDPHLPAARRYQMSGAQLQPVS